MEYLEDPRTQSGYDYRGMHLLRQRTLIPIAADGHYTPSRLVEPSADAPDVVLGDITGAGGQSAMRYRMAQAFDLGLSIHSGYECGRIAARPRWLPFGLTPSHRYAHTTSWTT